MDQQIHYFIKANSYIRLYNRNINLHFTWVITDTNYELKGFYRRIVNCKLQLELKLKLELIFT